KRQPGGDVDRLVPQRSPGARRRQPTAAGDARPAQRDLGGAGWRALLHARPRRGAARPPRPARRRTPPGRARAAGAAAGQRPGRVRRQGRHRARLARHGHDAGGTGAARPGRCVDLLYGRGDRATSGPGAVRHRAAAAGGGPARRLLRRGDRRAAADRADQFLLRSAPRRHRDPGAAQRGERRTRIRTGVTEAASADTGGQAGRSAGNVAGVTSETSPTPPIAKRVPTERTHHGDTVIDEYAWLANKDDPDTLAYLTAENAYTEAMTAHLAPLRETLFEETRRRTQETDLSVPTRKGGYWYYTRTEEGKQYEIYCRRAVRDGETEPPTTSDGGPLPGEEVLLDCNALAEGREFFALGTFDVSPDGRLLAYSTDVVGDERFTLRVIDLDTGAVLADEIPNVFYGSAWSADGSTLFYVTVD